MTDTKELSSSEAIENSESAKTRKQSFNDKIGSFVKESKQAINLTFINPIVEVFVHLLNFSRQSKQNFKLATFLLVVGGFITIFGFLVSYQVYIKPFFDQPTSKVQKTIDSNQEPTQTKTTSTTSNVIQQSPRVVEINLKNEQTVITPAELQNQQTPKPENSKIIDSRGVGGGPEEDTVKDGGKRVLSFMFNDVFRSQTQGLMNGVYTKYISYTADPTGRIKKEVVEDPKTMFKVDWNINKDSKIQFATLEQDSNFLYTTDRYSGLLTGIIAPIMVLLLVISGIQIMTLQANADLFQAIKDRMIKLIISMGMIFVFTPALLSLSVLSTNMINNIVLKSATENCKYVVIDQSDINEVIPKDGRDLGCYFNSMVKNILGDKPKDVEIKGWDFVGLLKVWGNNVSGYFLVVLIIALILITLFLMLIISFQFIFRFFNLYLLFCIHPIMSLLWYNEKTSHHYSNYWKQIITLLIHQPLFLIGFVIFGDMASSMTTDILDEGLKSNTLDKLLIYIAFLVFLIAVPSSMASKLVGEFSNPTGAGQAWGGAVRSFDIAGNWLRNRGGNKQREFDSNKTDYKQQKYTNKNNPKPDSTTKQNNSPNTPSIPIETQNNISPITPTQKDKDTQYFESRKADNAKRGVYK